MAIPTASSMMDVVNRWQAAGNAYAYDMPLDKDMQQAYDELKAAVQELNRGQGILLVYDMGSLRTMAEIITRNRCADPYGGAAGTLMRWTVPARPTAAVAG